MTSKITRVLGPILGLVGLAGRAFAQVDEFSSGDSGFGREAASNLWTRAAFGPIQLVWFAVAIVIGFVGYYVFYRGMLTRGLSRVPVPLEPGRLRLSAAGCGLLIASFALGAAGYGYVYLACLMVVAGALDGFGGRYWIFWISPAMAIGLCILGFLHV